MLCIPTSKHVGLIVLHTCLYLHQIAQTAVYLNVELSSLSFSPSLSCSRSLSLSLYLFIYLSFNYRSSLLANYSPQTWGDTVRHTLRFWPLTFVFCIRLHCEDCVWYFACRCHFILGFLFQVSSVCFALLCDAMFFVVTRTSRTRSHGENCLSLARMV